MIVTYQSVSDAAWMLLLLLICTAVQCKDYSLNETKKSNILVLSPYTAPSHSNFIRPVVKELASRGHSVTYWNGLKPAINDESLKYNLKQLYSPSLDELNSDEEVTFADRGKGLFLIWKTSVRIFNVCKIFYNDPIFHQLMTSDEQFDLVIAEGFGNDCVLPLVHKFKAPLVYLGVVPTPWHLDAIGSPLAFDHYPLLSFSFTDRMNFWQRSLNTLSGFFVIYFRNWILMPIVDGLASQMLTNISLPSVRKIEQESLSLLITNTDSSMNYQLPLAPNIIQAGGLHCVPSKPLPKVVNIFVSTPIASMFIRVLDD
jgi:glucuronosyltransferase